MSDKKHTITRVVTVILMIFIIVDGISSIWSHITSNGIIVGISSEKNGAIEFRYDTIYNINWTYMAALLAKTILQICVMAILSHRIKKKQTLQ